MGYRSDFDITLTNAATGLVPENYKEIFNFLTEISEYDFAADSEGFSAQCGIKWYDAETNLAALTTRFSGVKVTVDETGEDGQKWILNALDGAVINRSGSTSFEPNTLWDEDSAPVKNNAQHMALKAIAETFIARAERGEVRSVNTVAAMREALAMPALRTFLLEIVDIGTVIVSAVTPEEAVSFSLDHFEVDHDGFDYWPVPSVDAIRVYEVNALGKAGVLGWHSPAEGGSVIEIGHAITKGETDV